MKVNPVDVELIDLLNRYTLAAIDNAKWGREFDDIARHYAIVRAEVEVKLMFVPPGPYVVEPCRGHFHVAIYGQHVSGALDEVKATEEAEHRNAEYVRDARDLIDAKDRRIAELEAQIKAMEGSNLATGTI